MLGFSLIYFWNIQSVSWQGSQYAKSLSYLKSLSYIKVRTLDYKSKDNPVSLGQSHEVGLSKEAGDHKNRGVTNTSLAKVHSSSWALPVTLPIPTMPVGNKTGINAPYHARNQMSLGFQCSYQRMGNKDPHVANNFITHFILPVQQ